MTLRLITPPATEPVDIEDIKDDAGLDDTVSDATLTAIVKAVRQNGEASTGRAFITQTWELVLDAFPANEIQIGKLPIQSISSVTYYDSSGTLQTMDAEDYAVDKDLLPGWLLPAFGTTWPATYNMANAVVVRFVAGYGDAASDVPEPIKLWIRSHAAHEADKGKDQTSVSEFVEGLLDPYKLFFA